MSDKLIELIEARAATAVAIVGMTKNVGKTVTLNYLIDRYTAAKRILGLVSAGYDGERFDRLTLKDKPRIHAPAGSFVATARACIDAAEAVLEPLYRSRLATPLGEVWVAAVRKGGLVELAGPGSVSGLKHLVEDMKKRGAERILVDGAINRLASASPAVTSGMILASGASVAPVLEDVIRKTIFRCELLETPPVRDSLLERKARDALNGGEAAVLHRKGRDWEAELFRAPIPLMTGPMLKERCRAAGAMVVLGGALVDSFLSDLLELPTPPCLILRDATRIFVSPDTYYRYLKRGGDIRVLDPIDLIAVTLNPTDPLGKGYPPHDFLLRLEEALAPRPVFDLMLNRGSDQCLPLIASTGK
ncbi:MAG TPA: hypothetical protein PLY40_04215 [Bacillota bacterium]|nr:hypothetical protein [Bacillota bacterium]